MWRVSADPLRFEEASKWFREKIPLTKEEWTTLQEDARRRGFFISGVTYLDLLADVWFYILEAIDKGVPYGEFAKAVGPKLAAAWGQPRPYHLENVFRTNIQSAYSAGRWKQLQDPAVRQSRPYWMFDAVLDSRTTTICKSRNGVVRPADDPWWKANWPPLHYQCRSGVRALTQEEATKRGISTELPEEPPLEGFGGAPGEGDWVEGFAMNQRSEVMKVSWVPAFVGEPPTWKYYGRPERLPARKPPTKPLPAVGQVGQEAFLALLESVLGKLPAYITDPTGFSVVLDRELLDSIALDGREQYLSWLPDVIQDPEEKWLVPVRNENTVVFRQRYVKSYRNSSGRTLGFVVEFHRGVMVAMDVGVDLKEARWGFLRYAKPE